MTFGEIMLRLAPQGFERFLQTPAFVATLGGAEANVAVALASLGVPSRFITVLPPKNPLADCVISQLRGFGVETSGILRGEGRLGIYYLEAGANQRPSRVVYDREHSSMARARPGDIHWPSAFADCSLVSYQRHHSCDQCLRSRSGARIRPAGTRTRPHRFLRFELSEESLEVGPVGGGGDVRPGQVR